MPKRSICEKKKFSLEKLKMQLKITIFWWNPTVNVLYRKRLVHINTGLGFWRRRKTDKWWKYWKVVNSVKKDLKIGPTSIDERYWVRVQLIILSRTMKEKEPNSDFFGRGDTRPDFENLVRITLKSEWQVLPHALYLTPSDYYHLCSLICWTAV